MSPIGHTLVGASIGMIAIPQDMQKGKQASVFAAFILLANLPDFSLFLLYWEIQGYAVGHSLFVILALAIFVAFILRTFRFYFPQISRWRVILGGATCCLSHLLLDSFYNHGQGIPIYWPMSTAHLALPLPWFGHWPVTPPFLTWETVRVSFIECLIYGPFLIVATTLRFFSTKQNRKGEKEGIEYLQ
jgi:membrane-bound metal-dependent hydrolase YbcI (DUF457 family)